MQWNNTEGVIYVTGMLVRRTCVQLFNYVDTTVLCPSLQLSLLQKANI